MRLAQQIIGWISFGIFLTMITCYVLFSILFCPSEALLTEMSAEVDTVVVSALEGLPSVTIITQNPEYELYLWLDIEEYIDTSTIAALSPGQTIFFHTWAETTPSDDSTPNVNIFSLRTETETFFTVADYAQFKKAETDWLNVETCVEAGAALCVSIVCFVLVRIGRKKQSCNTPSS